MQLLRATRAEDCVDSGSRGAISKAFSLDEGKRLREAPCGRFSLRSHLLTRRSHVEAGREDGLTRFLARAQSANLFRTHRADRREAKSVEGTQGLSVDAACAADIGRGFMNCGHCYTAVFAGHCLAAQKLQSIL